MPLGRTHTQIHQRSRMQQFQKLGTHGPGLKTLVKSICLGVQQQQLN